jgi:hypothetical protein
MIGVESLELRREREMKKSYVKPTLAKAAVLPLITATPTTK